MRVVIGIPWGERLGGAENRLYTFLQHVDRSKVEPLVVFLADGAFPREVEELGIRTAVLPTGRLRHGGRFPRTVRSLRALLRRERPDVILAWGAKPQLYLAPAALLAGMSDRVAWWQVDFPSSHPLHALATLLPARAVACSSRFVAAEQEQRWPHRRTFVVHPGIAPVDEPAPDEVEQLRAGLAIPVASAVVGSLGRLEPRKRHDVFLRALAELRLRGYDVHGLLVGGDAHGIAPRCGPELRRLAAELALESAVTFAGQAAPVAPYLKLMDVFVSASPHEAFGIAVLEAMALGVPVVAVAAGPAEILENERSGLLVPGPEPVLLADAVERLLTDDRLRAGLGEGGRERFRERFTAERMTDELTERLLELAA